MNKNELFINKANLIHSGEYDYSKVNYVRNHDKVIIICNKHGEFLQTPANHLSGKGCKFCGSESSKLKRSHSKEIFVAKANEVHNGIFDYSKSIYINDGTDLVVTCNYHGDFIQSPNNHLRGKGCPTCGLIKNFKWVGRIPLLYLVKVFDDNEVFLKIGVTAQKLNLRLRERDFPYNYSPIILKKLCAEKAFAIEQNLLAKFNDFRYSPNKKFGGYTECLSINNIEDILTFIKSNLDE